MSVYQIRRAHSAHRARTPLALVVVVVLLAVAAAGACGPDRAGEGAGDGPGAPAAAPPLATSAEIAAVLGGGWGVRVVAPETAGTASDVAVAPAGGRILVGAQDGSVSVVRPGAALRVLRGHAARVLRVVFAPGARAFASTSADGTARIDGGDGAPTVVLRGDGAPAVDVLFAADGGRVAMLGVDGTLRLFGADGTESAAIGGGAEPIDRIAALPGASAIVAASRSLGALEIVGWDGVVRARIDGLGEGAERFAIAARGDAVVVGGTDGRVIVWTPRGRRDAQPHEAAVQDVAFAPDGSCFATASLDGTARVYELDGTLRVRVIGHGAPLHRVALLPGGGRVLTVGADRRAVLWDADGKRIAVIADVVVTDGAFVAAGRAVLAWSGDGPAQAMDIHGAPLRAAVGMERGIVRLVTATDGDAFAWIAPDRTVRTALVGDAGSPAAVAAAHPSEAYTSPERCARCHRAAYRRWVQSSHAWTSSLASPDSLPRDVLRGREVFHPPGVTRFAEDDGGWTAETIGVRGTAERFRLTHVAGHKRMKMLLATMDDGRIQVLPAMIEWPDGPWFDYTQLLYGAPDEDLDTAPTVRPGEASFWTGAVRSWDQKCAFCHTSGRLAREPGPGGRGPRSSWRSLGVDCETCHGPGRAHAEAWERGETGAPLRRLEDLPRADAIAVCTQCHMEGDRVTPTYRIGDDLYEHLDPTLALSPERADPYGRELELMYDGLPFGTSHCAESGGLTCSRYHEPHGSDRASQLRLSPSSGALCGDCHADVADAGRAHTSHDPRGSGGACVGCHMPFLTIERGHGAVTDHTIGVPRLDLPGDRVAKDACTWCHSAGRNAPRDAPRIGAEALRDAYARWWPQARPPRPWMRALAAARTGDATAGAALLSVARDMSNPLLVRASAVRLLERSAAAHRAALLALATAPESLVRRSALLALRPLRGPDIDGAYRAALDDASLAVRVVAARAALAGWERVRADQDLLRAAIPILEEDVRGVTDDYYRWFLLGAARGLAGDDAGALAAYERVLVLDPLSAAVRTHVERLRERLSSGR